MLKLIAAAATAVLLAAPVALADPQTQTPTTLSAAKAKKDGAKPLSSGMAAMRDRQRKCGAEWKEAKAAGKIEKGQTWPKYWSACNKRLKAA